MKKNLILLIIIIILGCKEKRKTIVKNSIPMNYSFVDDYNNKDKINNLCKKALIDGDTLAFKELKHIYMLSEHAEEFLYISTVMAEKYNHSPAYQMNYSILKIFKQPIMQKFAIYNLIKAYELGNKIIFEN